MYSEEETRVAVQRVADALAPVLSLALYLCVDSKDIREARGTAKLPQYPQTKTTKKRPQPFLQGAHGATTYDVGHRIGAALRRAYAARDAAAPQGGTHRSPIPHIRKAHWHTVLSGPRTEERIRDLRWFPPIPVNLDDPDDLVAVVRPVKP